MKPRIAISAPMDIPMVHLCEVEDLLNENFKIPYSHISFWDRKSAYDQKSFDSADAVVFILPNFSFDSAKVKLGYEIPIGVRSELNLAIKQEKKIYIAYKTASGEINIYNVSYTVGRIPKDYSIKGIAGTSNEFGEWVEGLALVGISLKENSKSETKQVFFIDEKEREEEIRKWAEVHRINQAELEIHSSKMMQNYMYGSFGELDHPDCNEVLNRWKKAGFLENTDPIEQVKFPKMQRVYAQLIPNPDYADERLLLML